MVYRYFSPSLRPLKSLMTLSTRTTSHLNFLLRSSWLSLSSARVVVVASSPGILFSHHLLKSQLIYAYFYPCQRQELHVPQHRHQNPTKKGVYVYISVNERQLQLTCNSLENHIFSAYFRLQKDCRQRVRIRARISIVWIALHISLSSSLTKRWYIGTHL